MKIMEQFKNIIMDTFEHKNTFGYEIWSIVKDGDKFEIFKRLIPSDEKNLKLGQEVNLQRNITSSGVPSEIFISGHDNSHLIGRVGQIKRLNNIKFFAIEYLKTELTKKNFFNFYNNVFLKSKQYDFEADEGENLMAAFGAFNYDKVSKLEETITNIMTENQEMPNKLISKNLALYNGIEKDRLNFGDCGFEKTLNQSKTIENVLNYLKEATNCVQNHAKQEDKCFE